MYGSYICCHYHLLKGFRTAFGAIQDDVPGFEFCVREEISRILFYIYRENEDVITKPQGERNHDTDRLGMMLSYIYSNCSKEISLRALGNA